MSKTFVFKVSIHCNACIEKVDKVLRKIEGVDQVDIDAEMGTVTVSAKVDPEVLLKAIRKKAGRRAELLSSEGGNDNDPSDVPPENDADGEKEADETDGDGQNGGVDRPHIPMVYLGPPGYLQEGVPAPEKFSPPPDIGNHGRPPVRYTDPYTNTFSDDNPNACSIM